MTGLRRQIPSANALFVFEAAARAGSFTRAAAELNVTQPAISRMLGRLEQHLGVHLFERSATGIRLTDDGRMLYRTLATSFAEIETTIGQIRARRTAGETVALSLSSAFTTHWLMPRIHQFRRAFPNVDLRFHLISGSLHGSIGDVDLGMRFVPAESPEVRAWLFAPEQILPVCSPDYLKEHGPLGQGDGEQSLVDLSDGTPRWRDLAERFGLARHRPLNVMTYSDYAVVLQAALFGHGVALGWNSVVSLAMRNGQLIPAGPPHLRTERLCQLVAPSDKPMRAVVAEIRDWLLAEMAADQRAIRRLYPEVGAEKRGR